MLIFCWFSVFFFFPFSRRRLVQPPVEMQRRARLSHSGSSCDSCQRPPATSSPSHFSGCQKFSSLACLFIVPRDALFIKMEHNKLKNKTKQKNLAHSNVESNHFLSKCITERKTALKTKVPQTCLRATNEFDRLNWLLPVKLLPLSLYFFFLAPGGL